MNEREMAEELVERGATLLDRTVPAWWLQIDESELDMSNIYQCVLGQNFGRYGEGLSFLFGEDYGEEPFEHGFDSGDVSIMRLLTDVWLDAVLERRLQASVFKGNPSCPWPRPTEWVD